MNYYERHLGDYAKDTAHLSMLEHGAYTLLLDRYYSTEQGIPEDQVYRLARARSKEERAAVDAVLADFFQLLDGAWINRRTDREIAKFHEASPDREAKRENERERQRRARERRKAMFETLRAHNIVPAYDMPMHELQALLSRVTSAPVTPTVTRDATATQTPDPRHQTNTEPAAPMTVVGREPETDVSGFVPTPAGLICQALRKAGLGSVNPSHPRLTALIAAGATAEEFLAFAPKAIAEGDEPFAYLLGAVEGERKRAARTAGQIHRGPMPAAQQQAETPYQRAMRERVAAFAPGLESKAPGQFQPLSQAFEVIDAIDQAAAPQLGQ